MSIEQPNIRAMSEARAPQSLKRPQKRKRKWFDWHSWVGLKLSMFLSFVLVTGTIAVFSTEIDWLFTPEMRTSANGRDNLPLGALYDSAKKTHPDWRIIFINAPQDPWFTAQAAAYRPDGELRRIFVDPYTGEVRGNGPWFNVQRFFRETHRNLFLPTFIGVPLVGSLAFLMAGSLVTGIVVYKKWWRGFFKKPRTQNSRVFLGDLHRLGGLWSMWFITLIVLTSIWYVLESTGLRAPPPPTSTPTTIAETPTLAGTMLQQKVEEAFPELTVQTIGIPSGTGRAFVFQGQATANLVRVRANRVSVDPLTGEVTHIVNAEDLSLHQRISEMADPLHFGTFGGLTTRIIWFIFGVILCAISITGVCIFAKRCAKNIEDQSGLKAAWNGMTFGRYVTVALAATYIIAGIIFMS